MAHIELKLGLFNKIIEQPSLEEHIKNLVKEYNSYEFAILDINLFKRLKYIEKEVHFLTSKHMEHHDYFFELIRYDLSLYEVQLIEDYDKNHNANIKDKIFFKERIVKIN